MKLRTPGNTVAARFVETLLKVKGITFERDDSTDPATTIQDRELYLDDPLVIADYIEAKHPYPPLIDAEIPKRAVMLTLVSKILNGLVPSADLSAYLTHCRPFVLGARISILDVAVNAALSDIKLTEAINAVAQRSVF